MAAGWTIGRLADEVGVNAQTVRYYERRKLLLPSSRRPSGYRVYDNEALKRLRFIKNAQALGFTLREIGEVLRLRVNSRARCGDVQRKAEDKLRGVEVKMKDLQVLARALRSLIRTCQARQPIEHCRILHHLEGAQASMKQLKKGRSRDRSSG